MGGGARSALGYHVARRMQLRVVVDDQPREDLHDKEADNDEVDDKKERRLRLDMCLDMRARARV